MSSSSPRVTFGLTTQQLLMASSLVGIALVSWWITAAQGMTMEMGMYPLEPINVALFALSWTIGMIAMMFPTTIPMMLMLIQVGKTARPEVRTGGGPTAAKASLFIGSYVMIWTFVGVVMYLTIAFASNLLEVNTLSTALGSSLSIALAFLIVGVYQLSPIKGECLERCHPTNFLFRYYRGGLVGAAKMGVFYAKYCVGCCWVMVIFLLLVGAMGVVWMAVFAGLIFVERTVVHERWPSRVIGFMFLSIGGIRLILP